MLPLQAWANRHITWNLKSSRLCRNLLRVCREVLIIHIKPTYFEVLNARLLKLASVFKVCLLIPFHQQQKLETLLWCNGAGFMLFFWKLLTGRGPFFFTQQPGYYSSCKGSTQLILLSAWKFRCTSATSERNVSPQPHVGGGWRHTKCSPSLLLEPEHAISQVSEPHKPGFIVQ